MLGRDSNTVVEPAGFRPVVGVGRRPELESHPRRSTSSGWPAPRRVVDRSERVACQGVDHDVGDVLFELGRQRQRVDTGSTAVRQVSRDGGATAVLQTAETAHARHQGHLRLGRCTHAHNTHTVTLNHPAGVGCKHDDDSGVDLS